jgi:hypothetical protein
MSEQTAVDSLADDDAMIRARVYYEHSQRLPKDEAISLLAQGFRSHADHERYRPISLGDRLRDLAAVADEAMRAGDVIRNIVRGGDCGCLTDEARWLHASSMTNDLMGELEECEGSRCAVREDRQATR